MRLSTLAPLLAPLAALSVLALPTRETVDLVARENGDVDVARAFGAVDPDTGSIANVERQVSLRFERGLTFSWQSLKPVD